MPSLSGLTGAAGSYVLTLTATGSGIKDAAGNSLAANASDAWTVDLTAPTANVVDVTPDPRNSAVSSIDIVFSERVNTLALSNLTLTRNGTNLLPASATLTTADNITWTLGSLAGGLTGTAGSYVLTLTASGVGHNGQRGQCAGPRMRATHG